MTPTPLVQTIEQIALQCLRAHGGLTHGNYPGFCPSCTRELAEAVEARDMPIIDAIDRLNLLVRSVRLPSVVDHVVRAAEHDELRGLLWHLEVGIPLTTQQRERLDILQALKR